MLQFFLFSLLFHLCLIFLCEFLFIFVFKLLLISCYFLFIFFSDSFLYFLHDKLNLVLFKLFVPIFVLYLVEFVPTSFSFLVFHAY